MYFKLPVLTLLICLISIYYSKAQTVDSQDSLALLMLVDTTKGNNLGGWNKSLPPSNQWTNSNPVSQWQGITTTVIGSKRKVTSIEVAGLGLQGSFPNFIFNGNQLEELRVLDFGNNQLNGQLSSMIFENLPQLEILYLNDNFLTQTLPVVVGNQYNLSKLQQLDLSNNSFEGDLNLDWILGSQITESISSGTTTTIQQLKFHSNNFKNVLLNSNNAQFDSLAVLYVDNNSFHFDDLHILSSGLKMPQMLGQHYVPRNAPMISGSPDTLAFRYSPQANAGIGGVRRRPSGAVFFNSGIGEPTAAGIYNTVNWSRLQGATSEILGTVKFLGSLPILSNLLSHTATLGSVILAPNNDRQTILLNNIDISHHDWLYKACASNDSFPLLQICMLPKKLIVGACFDDLGNEIACQEIIVQFEKDATDTEKEELRKEFGITILESCMCGTIEMWGLPDTLNAVEVEANGKGTKRSAGQARTRPNMLGSDPDYDLLAVAPLSTGDTAPNTPSGTTHSNSTLVAIIDSGVDYDHPSLKDRIWINPDESSNGSDDDNNCVSDDNWGYNFLEHSGIPYDDHGHGSAIAGIVTGQSLPNQLPNATTYDSLAILPIKFTNRDGKGTLFHAACGLRYAANYHNTSNGQKVRIMNASWGYYGEPSTILEQAIRHAGEECGLLFICSAGNNGLDNDVASHYPSNFDLENILVVGAYEDPLLGAPRLTSYSNFGANNVDIAAIGNFTTTGALPLGLGGLETVSGTSFATAQVSRAAGFLFHKYPEASYRSVKAALMDGVDKFTGSDSSKIASKGILNYSNSLALLTANNSRNNCMPAIGLNLLLEGPLDTLTGQMRVDVYTNGQLPMAHPFNTAPWNYNGLEVLTGTFPTSIKPVDWVLVAICNGNSCVHKAAILLNDGSIIDADGTALDLPALPSNTCSIQITPSNHLATTSTQTFTLTEPYSSINLMGLLSNTKTIGGYEVLPAGDANGDGQINAVDKNAYWRVNSGQSGYLKGDYNLDGTINNLDYQLWLKNQHLESDCSNCRKSVN